MWNSERNLNTSDKQSISSSGLFSDYDSRMRRPRFSLNSNNSLSIRSPNRTSSKMTKLPSDENYISKYNVSSTENETTPIRRGSSPFRPTPLSHSKRFNINSRSNLSLSPGRLYRSTGSSLMDESSTSKSFIAANSLARMNLSVEEEVSRIKF